jgi:hypothetical protein
MGREREIFVDDVRETEWRACPHCGARVQRVARRCLACHRDLEAEEPNSAEDPAPSRAATLSRPRGARGAWLTLALVIPCAALACVGAIYFILWLTNSLAAFPVGS